MIYATSDTHGNFQRFAPEPEPQPVDCPSERGRNYTPVEPVRCVLPEAPCREQMISADFQSVPIITGEATLPLRWLPPATPLWTCCPRTPCATSCSRSASFTIGRYTFLKR